MVEGQNSKQLVDFLMREDYSALQCSLDKSISEEGWESTKNIFISALKDLCSDHWLALNWVLLRIFDLAELIGYDGCIVDILSSINEVENTLELRERICSDLIERILIQLKRGKSTLLFDIEKMKSKPSVILIPELILARQREVLALDLKKKHRRALNLQSALRTTYGFEVILREDKIDSLKFLEEKLSMFLETCTSSFSLVAKPTTRKVLMSKDFTLFHNAMVLLLLIYKGFFGRLKFYEILVTEKLDSSRSILSTSLKNSLMHEEILQFPLINRIVRKIISYSPEIILEHILDIVNYILQGKAKRNPKLVLDGKYGNIEFRDLNSLLQHFELLRGETSKPRKQVMIDDGGEWARLDQKKAQIEFEERERKKSQIERQQLQQVKEVLDLIETRNDEKELKIFRDWMNSRKKDEEG